MEEITLTEFRKKTRECFDVAREGHTIYIKRGKELFLLVSSDAVKEAREAAKKQMAVYTPKTEVDLGETMPEVYSHRTKGDILADIKLEENTRNDLLANCQDSETSREIEKKAKITLDKLWTEYNSIGSN